MVLVQSRGWVEPLLDFLGFLLRFAFAADFVHRDEIGHTKCSLSRLGWRRRSLILRCCSSNRTSLLDADHHVLSGTRQRTSAISLRNSRLCSYLGSFSLGQRSSGSGTSKR